MFHVKHINPTCSTYDRETLIIQHVKHIFLYYLIKKQFFQPFSKYFIQ